MILSNAKIDKHIHTAMHMSHHISVHKSLRMSIHKSMRISIHTSTYMSARMSKRMFVHMLAHISTHVSSCVCTIDSHVLSERACETSRYEAASLSSGKYLPTQHHTHSHAAMVLPLVIKIEHTPSGVTT